MLVELQTQPLQKIAGRGARQAVATFMFLIAERHAQAIEYLLRVVGKVEAQDLLLHAVAGICLHGGIPQAGAQAGGRLDERAVQCVSHAGVR